MRLTITGALLFPDAVQLSARGSQPVPFPMSWVATGPASGMATTLPPPSQRSGGLGVRQR
jgi:hypothetical protein